MEMTDIKKFKNTKQIVLSINMVRGCGPDSYGRQGCEQNSELANSIQGKTFLD